MSENINGRANPSAFAKASADKPGSATEGVINLKGYMNRCQSISRLVPERGRSGYIFRRREAGLLLRSSRLDKAFASKRPSEGGPVRRSYGIDRRSLSRRRSREGGWSLVEMTISLFLLISIAVVGLQTMISGWMMQNSSIMQSMTDAYAGIETAYAQRWTFANIPTDGRWPVYPASNSTVVTIGKTPKGPVNATVVRTSYQYSDPLTGAQSYMLESYVLYKDHLRQYCKLSKVYRAE
jgi:hypothetical protein